MLSAAARTLAAGALSAGTVRTDGLVEVPFSVRELADRTGRSPGTIQALLRQLDRAGVRVCARRRLFDPSRLKDPLLADLILPVSPRPSRGGPRDSGDPSCDRDAGRTVGAAASEGRTGDRTDGPGDDAAAALVALVALVRADPHTLEEAQVVAAGVLARAAGLSGRADEGVGCATVRDGARPSKAARSVAREPVRKEARTTDEALGEDAVTGSSFLPEETVRAPEAALSRTPRTSGAGPRTAPAGLVAGPGGGSPGGAAVVRSAAELRVLLAPLLAACERLGLPGITNSALLGQRLAPFTDRQVRYAVSRLLLEVNAGALRSPVGKLAKLAQHGDGDYFVIDAPEVRLAGDPAPVPPPVEPLPPVDGQLARRALEAARESLGR